ncbi:hypothetical protein AKJ09_10571 [Labilithrix luteola]|uniref:Uncharacterized protein n=1 Tax=Labilithrix luteola TaxID=1391654 RepID=A0A0K1QDW0_9BACT|nr:hypothetical protein AKJ09_10571 [Labilithrix luteola]
MSPGLTGADASAGPDAGGGDGSPSSDGGPFDDGGGGNDASDADGEGGSSGYPDPVVIVSGAGIAAPSGNAQQQHLVFVKPNDTYWFFTLSGTKDFAAFSSKDFKSWSSAHTLAMPVAHGSDGRNVGIAAMPNAAVVHAAIACFDGSGATHVHARATLPSDVIAFDAPRTVSSIGAPKTTVGGPATTILTAGGNIVVDALDLVSDGGTFNGAVWRFGSESGTSFSSQAPIQDEFYFPKSWINAQTLVPLTSGGLLWVAENAEAEPDPPNLAFGVYASGSWTGGAVFAVDATQNYNDWSVFRVSDTEMHAVRYAASVGFEHARFTGTTWQPGGTIPAMTPLVGGGLVLVGEGSTFSLYAIDVGAARTVKTVAWDGTKWASSWHDVTTKAAVRTFLGGMSTPGHKAVYWTQENSGALDVVGVSIP